MDLNITYWGFGPLLAKTRVSPDLLTFLMVEGQKLKKEANTRLAGHIEKELEYERNHQDIFIKMFYPYFKSYSDFLRNNWYQTAPRKVNPIPEKPNIMLHNLWINFMKSGEYNPYHRHGGDFSFVIYLDVPDNIHEENQKYIGTSAGPGAIDFIFGQVGQNDIATTSRYFLPHTGDLFLFPACLSHSVAPFKSDVERVSVSGNISYFNDNKV